jgi:tetratricopeptide (TPR) repeat protein
LIICAGLVAYGNSFAGPFFFDDITAIAENPNIKRLWPIQVPLFPPSEGPAVTALVNRPVASLSLAINWALHGGNVWGYHAFNLAVHILAALALFGIVRRTLLLPSLRRRTGGAPTALALAAAVIWLVHPLHTDAVTYIIQRTESMMGMLYLLTLYCAIRSLSSAKAGWWQAAAVAACLLGMGTKEAMVTAPIMVLLYDRVFVSASLREALRRRRVLYACLAATWLLPAALLILSGGGRGAAAGFARGMTAWQYARTQFGVIVRYLRLSFWPSPLIVDYGTPVADAFWEIAPYAAIIAVLLAATVVALRHRPRIGFLGAWFFLTLAPSSSVVPLVTQTAAEKRMYLPLAAVVVLVVVGAYAAWRRLLTRRAELRSALRAVSRGAAVAAAAAIVCVLTYRTRLRSLDYRTELSLWLDTARKAPDNDRARNNAGLELLRRERYREAVGHFRRVVQINPDFFPAHNRLGEALVKTGRRREAIECFREAVRLKPDYYQAHNNLGAAYMAEGDGEAGIRHLRKAIAIRGDYPPARLRLGMALRNKGDLVEAAEMLRAAVDLSPQDLKARLALCDVLERLGDRAGAITHYREALQVRGDSAMAMANLAWLLAVSPEDDLRNGSEAVRLAQQACRIEGDAHRYLSVLAAAEAEAGRFARAVSTITRAIRLARRGGEDDLARRYQAQLRLFRRRKPLRIGM